MFMVEQQASEFVCNLYYFFLDAGVWQHHGIYCVSLLLLYSFISTNRKNARKQYNYDRRGINDIWKKM